MKTIFVTILLSCIANINAYPQEVKYVNKICYRGYIFPEEFDVLLSIEEQKGRFTPNEETIKLLEINLRKDINRITEKLVNQGKGCPKINKRTLKRYQRQYFGFINENNEKIVFINFVWSRSINEIKNKLNKDLVTVYDGCSHYWIIQYNITQKRFYNLNVNIRS